ncbi:hypothetical protein CVT26_008289 [Gymnopilus dilepis]|uniref:Tc1-like transposase DDE domain-containing protein n=1 Tax=Gymnopilus dilepis TaxID=231916 RepID=A0A409X2J4_9AGAR|nr:hypothetical protein CVT26_008289 [Gymnopilus dilepis]
MVRGKPLSDDLRSTILNMARHLDVPSIRYYTGCPIRTIRRILSEYRRTGTVLRQQLLKQTLRGRKQARLTSAHIKFLQGTIRHSPDIYLDELKELLEDRIGLEVDESTIWRALRRSGFTMKKLTRDALERNEERRGLFRLHYGQNYTPEQTVFVDESSFDRRTSVRGKAWALSGQRAVRKCFFVRGRRYSLLPALSFEGIIWAKVVEGSFTKRLFQEFIAELLDRMQPFPAPKSVIVMDNARIHKNQDIVDMIHARGMRIVYLPPYSPDYNPIELAFSTIKAFVRRQGLLGREDLDQAQDDTYVYLHLLDAAYSINGNKAIGYFHHCGYI